MYAAAVDATPTPDDQRAVEATFCAQRVGSYASNMHFAVAGSLFAAALFWWLQAKAVPAGPLQAWFGAVVASQLLRIAIGLWHRRSAPGSRNDKVWLTRYRLVVLVHGVVWALAALLPIDANNNHAEALRAIVVVGMVGGSFALLAFDLPAAMGFGVPALGGLCLHLWTLPQPVYTLLGWAGLGTLVFFSLCARRAGQVVQQYVALQVIASRQSEALRHSETRLAEESAALQVTLESISQGILNVRADGCVRVFNRRANQLLGLPESLDLKGVEAVKVRAMQVANGDLPPGGYIDAGGQYRPLPQALDAAPAVYVRRARNGQLIEVRSRRLPEGGTVRTYADVTDYVRVQQALTAAKEAAERANQAKSQFLSGMSHELRTPLNAILGFSQVLLADRQTPLHPTHREPMVEIVHGAQHLLQLINDLLDLAVVESGQLSVNLAPVRVAPLLQSSLGLVRPLASHAGITLPNAQSCLVMHGNATVQADSTRLLQVLLNLLSNAIKYNRPGGAVRLTCAPAPSAGGTQPERLRISVSDDGPGLDATQCVRLFEPFERLGASHGAIEGAGLGLALSRRLVLAMAGDIGVHSQPGAGSTFWVDLPRANEQGEPGAHELAETATSHVLPTARSPIPQPTLATVPPQLSRPPQPAAAPDGHSVRPVLYIEDNPINAMLMESMVRLLGGPPLVVAERGAEGLQLAQSLNPVLILLDIELPDMNGYEVLHKLQQHPGCRAIPVVAVSANAMPGDVAQGLAAGFVHYLTKPVALAQLQAVMSATLDPAAGQT